MNRHAFRSQLVLIGIALTVVLSASTISPRAVPAQSASFLIEPVSGLVTSEDGGNATFSVALASRPDSAVHVEVSSSDSGEGAVSPSQLTLSPGGWETPATVTVTGVADGVDDGDVAYTIVLSPATSNDELFAGQDPQDVAVVNLNVAEPAAVDATPAAVDDNLAETPIEEDQPVTIDVLANDSGLEDVPLTLEVVAGPSDGATEVTAENQIIYTPAENFNGEDRFTYEVCDADSECSQAEVSLMVTPVNDAPTALEDSASTELATPVTIEVLANDSDVDGDPIFLASFDLLSDNLGLVARDDNGTPDDQGDDRLVYNPPLLGSEGTDTFNYVVSDGAAETQGMVTVRVGVDEGVPVANDDNYATTQNDLLNVTTEESVLENDVDTNETGQLTAILVTGPANGELEFAETGAFEYTPDEDFVGVDAFTYQANDGISNSNVATVTISINETNFAPVAANDHYTVGQLETLTIASPGVLENDGDSNGDPLASVLETAPEHGEVTLNEDGSLTYDPQDDYVGPDSFSYRADDGTNMSNLATVNLEVTDQLKPEVFWLSPATSGDVLEIDFKTINVTLTVEGEDNIGAVRAEFYRWDAVAEQFVAIGEDNQAPFEVDLDVSGLNIEWNQVFAAAYDAAGNKSKSDFIWLFRLHHSFLPVAWR
jgi:hypothetical protein